MDDLLVGRKEIMKEFRTNRWQTVLAWRRKYGFEFIRLPNGRPAIYKSQLKVFILKYNEKIQHVPEPQP